MPAPAPRRSSRPRRTTASVAAISVALTGLTGLTAVANAATGPVATAADAARTFAIVGSLQDETGCAADWDPACAATELAPTGADGVYAADFTVPAGTYEYKVAVNDSWDEAYGLNGGADNIPLVVGGPTTLRFTFDDVAKRVSLAPVGLGEPMTRRPTRRS